MEIRVNNQLIDHYIDKEDYIIKFFVKQFTTNKNTIDIWIPQTDKNRNIFGNNTEGEIIFSIFPYTCYYEIAGGGCNGTKKYCLLLISIDMVEYNRDKKLEQLGI